MLKNKFLAICFILFVLSNFSLKSQNFGTVTGRIISQATKKSLSGVTVRVLNTTLGAISKSDGSFEIKNVPVGIQQIQFTLIGYETYVYSDLSVISGKPVFIEIELVEKVIQLEGAEVKSSFFEKRIDAVTSTQYLNFEDIRRAPGVQEDVIRATALLPGVNVTAAGRNDLIVRGGAPFENLFIVDNIEVNNINHFGSQGSTGGPLSLINLDYVRNVEFSSGGFGVRYGDKTSSITNISLRNGNENQFGGKLNLSATGFGINLEGPLNNKGSWIISARRSYLDLIFQAAGFGFVPQYWDFMTKGNYRIDNNNTITFLGISAINDVKLNNDNEDKKYNNSRVSIPDQYQNFSGLTWRYFFDKGFLTSTIASAYTRFTTFQNDSNLIEIFRNNSKEGEIILKNELDYIIGDKSEIIIGNQLKYGAILDYKIKVPGFLRIDNNGIPQPLELDTTFNTIKNATYINFSTAFGTSKIAFGLRSDYYNFTNGSFYLSPRLSYTFTLNENSSFILSLGRYYQSPSYIWLLSNKEKSLMPIMADQIVLGYSHTPLEDVKVQFEIYYKKYENYPARIFRPQAVLSPSGFDDVSSDIPFGLEPLSSSAEGNSRGAELFIQKKLSDIPLYGLLSLTYSQSEFTSLDGLTRPSSYDSRFILNLSAGYRIGSTWEISTKFRYATGTPTTPFLEDGKLNFERYNEGERLADFNSLDLRIDKRWNFSWGVLITYLDIQNLYARKNVSGIRWDKRNSKPVFQESLGILPSIGISAEF